MWVKNRDRIINTGFSAAKAGILVLVMPIIFTVGCISFVAVKMLHVTVILSNIKKTR